jgi:PAS domain S-box-containing protein
MARLTNELFHLMLNLSRLRDRTQMLRTFLEAMGTWLPGLELVLYAEGGAPSREAISISTGERCFGELHVAGVLPPERRPLVHDAISMLAVLLENRLLAERVESENARLERAVTERTELLARSMAELHDLYDQAPTGYHSIDEAGVIQRMNATEGRWLGYAPGELEGRVLLRTLLCAEDHPRFDTLFRDFKAGTAAVKDVELTMLRRDGSRLPVLFNSTALRDGEGRFLGSRTSVIDVSERHQAQARLREAEARAQQAQKLEAVGRLAGGIAHDFNNLLTVILSGAEELQEGLAPADSRWEVLHDVHETAERAAVLTRQLLTFSRRKQTQPTRLDLNQVVEHLERMLHRLIGEDVELITAHAESSALVDADVGQLEQAIVNLVVNARDAMPEGGRIRLETAPVPLAQARQEGLSLATEWVRLTVHDTGTGMDAATLGRLFEPFFTTKPPGQGTGLGLATVYGIVHGAKGELRVQSTPGAGSHFSLYFPRAPTAVSTPQVAPPAQARVHGTGLVLLVEDEAAVRHSGARALREAGYQVLEADDGARALELTQALRPGALQALVTDLVMPHLGGAALARRLREQSPSLPVLFVSGYPDRDQPWEGPAGAGQAFLQKPYTAGSLSCAVQALLAR